MDNITEEQIKEAARIEYSFAENMKYISRVRGFIKGAKWMQEQQPKWIDVNVDIENIIDHHKNYYVVDINNIVSITMYSWFWHGRFIKYAEIPIPIYKP